MKKVMKVLLYVFRWNNDKIEFFVQDHHDGYYTVLSGHVGDNIPDESLQDAAERETIEELGVKPISVIDLKHREVVELKKQNKLSTEHAFLIEIPNKDVYYLEGNEKHIWVNLNDLENTLTFEHQKRAVSKLLKVLKA